MTTNDEKYQETITHTNGEMQAVIASIFDLDVDNICRWAIVVTNHVPDEPEGTHDIRVSSNCADKDTAVLLNLGKAAI